MEQRSHKLSLAIATALLVAGAQVRAAETPPPPAPAAEPAPPDLANWKCSKCEFDKGYTSEAQLGGGYVDEASAKFGDYTGLDQDGGYVVAGASGAAAMESGYRLEYQLEDLGLDSRSLAIEGGKQGAYEFGLSYDRIPHTISDTGVTPYRGLGSRDLTLPSGWVDAGSTAGMTALATTAHPVEPGFDRDRYGLFGRFFLGPNWSFAIDYKRDERSGMRPKFGSFGSVSVETLRPVDDSTDRVNATVRYQGAHWFAQAGYYLSMYQNTADTYRFDNPFFAAAAGGDVGQAALEPDNTYNEFMVSVGFYDLPWNTAITLSGATGKGTQDNAFAPYTINPNIVTDPLPFANLDGSVDVTRADLTIAMRPIDRLRLRGAVAYDQRDDNSRQGTFTSIVHTDLFPVSEDRVNAIYGYERTRLTGSADFDVYKDLTIGAGGEYRKTDRSGTKLEVSSETLQDGYGKAEWRPSGYLGFIVKGGVEERDPDKYDGDLGYALYGQNPLMRKYDMSYRYRSYGELITNVAVGSLPVTLSGNVYYGDDSYLQSDFGIIAGLDRRFGVDVNWAMNDKFSSYLSLTREMIASKTKNSSVFGAPDWRGDYEDNFDTYGLGFNAQLSDKWHANLDYTNALGHQRTTIVGVAAGNFPLVETKLSSLKASVTFAATQRMDLMATWWYETLDTRDWAFSGEPTAMPTVLGLGVDPYNYSVNYVTLSMRYRFGGPKGEESAAE